MTFDHQNFGQMILGQTSLDFWPTVFNSPTDQGKIKNFFDHGTKCFLKPEPDEESENLELSSRNSSSDSQDGHFHKTILSPIFR